MINLQHVAQMQQLCLNQGNNKAQSVDTSSVDKVSTSVESVDNLAFV